MKYSMKHCMRGLACLVLLALLTGCKKGSKSENNYDYLPVQLSKGDNWSIIDRDGKVVAEEEYPADATLTPISDGVFWVKQGDKYQLFSISQPKKPVMDEEFTQVTIFHAGRAAVSNPNQQIRIIDTKGKTVATLPKNIRQCSYFSDEGYAFFTNENNESGLLNTEGKIVINAEYEDFMMPVSDGLALVLKKTNDTQESAAEKQWWIIDMKGQRKGIISMGEYTFLDSRFREGKIVVKDKSSAMTTILDKTGKRLFSIRKAKGMNWSTGFVDGYLPFSNEDGKCGVADDKGEIVIRAKYEDLTNLGNGQFGAKKNDKWGIVNAKDETIIEFDYDMLGATMGDKFLVQDGSEFALINRDGKEIIAFGNVDLDNPRYVEFVDVEGLANGLITSIEGYEQPKTAAEKAKQHNLSVDDFHYRSYIGENQIGDKIKGNIEISYDGALAEEKTHTEKVDDGWFTYDRTVSDGYHWADVTPVSVIGTYSLESDAGIDTDLLYKSICGKLASGRKKIADGVFSKMVKFGGKTLECRTTVERSGDDITLNIQFRR